MKGKKITDNFYLAFESWSSHTFIAFYGGYENVDGQVSKINNSYFDEWLNEIDLRTFFKETRPKFRLFIC